MKLYVLRERWGKYVLSSRAPEESPIPEEPVAKAGVGFDMIHWGDWATKPFAEKVIIYNFLAKYAIETMKLYGPTAVRFINWRIAQGIAYEAAWGLWTIAGLVAAYAAVLAVMVYYAPDVVDLVTAETFPYRYIMRYNEKIWQADLGYTSYRRKGVYGLCGEIGSCVIGEDRNVYYPLGRADQWDTGYLWIQRKDRFIHHESWAWSNVWVEFIGFLYRQDYGAYILKAGYTDPYISELPPGFRNPYYCREWNPDYKYP